MYGQWLKAYYNAAWVPPASREVRGQTEGLSPRNSLISLLLSMSIVS